MLKFNNLGQWSLEKSGYADSDFNSYSSRANDGSLPQDRGQRGSVHGMGNKRAQKQTSDKKMLGTMPIPTSSAFADRNPGLKPRD